MFTAPARYAQGPGAIESLGELIAGRWHSAGVLVDIDLISALGQVVMSSLEFAGVAGHLLARRGEVTRAVIDRYTAEIPEGTEVVVAVGGGKTLDTGKSVALALGTELVTVPTIASNDGPTSRIIAEYDEEHQLVRTPQMPDNPALVVVDTAVISGAPAPFLLAGIGDAVAKRFEVAGCRRAGGTTPNGTAPLDVSSVIADACYSTLLESAEEAVSSLGSTSPSPALERVVEAVILLSGLAFENGGLSVAHALTRGLMRAGGAKRRPHGYHVAYGLLVQLAHEHDQASYDEVDGLFARLSLPRSLADLGAAPSEQVFVTMAKVALTAPHARYTVPTPTLASLVAAMKAVELAAVERR